MKVLTVCNWGEKRSRFLAECLRKKGFDADFCGINVASKNRISEERVILADCLVFAAPWIYEDFNREFFTDKQAIIVLDMEKEGFSIDELFVRIEKLGLKAGN